ncbi:MAG: transposase [Niabella sp.]|nr:transposase [Niabella sp.]
MSSRYKYTDKDGCYFVTATVVDWVDVFTRDLYRDILLNSFRFCQKHQGLMVYAWVLMPNHFHMICSFRERNAGLVLKNIKSFTAIKIIDAIINNEHESSRNWMLDIFEKHGRENKCNYRFQFWQHENHPILLDSEKKYQQRLDYLHQNPVRAGFVFEPQDWKHSSAMDYYTNLKGLLVLEA